MRLFIALELPQKQKELLKNNVDQLKPYLLRGGIVPVQNYHVTLQFLGEVDFSKVILLQNVMDELKRFNQTEISVSTFAYWRASDLLCAKFTADKELKAIFNYLAERLNENGFFCEQGKFTPHATLIRKPKFSLPVQEALKHATVFNKPFVANKVVLYCSELKPTGAEYTPIYEITLANQT